MTISSGTRLGPYEVLSPLGAGGMGEVYRAKDTRLGRDVAIKVLSDEIAGDPRALARFQTEAKAVAALSHPSIVALHDVGEAGGVHFAVMELVDGETLRAVLGRGPLPVRRALEIAAQLADALAAAHGKGIVHRDVKPENVVVSKDGHAKLLDFGLARQSVIPSDPAFTNSPTGDALTARGAVIGTVAYMSPEQAQGLPVDHRSDQFSLGTVLYEMLAGKKPFQGASTAEMLTAIIREEPAPLQERAPKVPAPVRWLVDRMLAKDPHGRYDTTRDLARDLRTLTLHVSETGIAAGAPGTTGAGRWNWRTLPGAGAAAVAIAIALAGALVAGALARRTSDHAAPVTRLEVRLPEGHYLSLHQRPFALSPDGKLLVFSAFTWKKPFEEENDSRLFLRPLDSFEARPIPGTEDAIQPVFSPDGRHVAFTAETEKGIFLKRVPVAGGPVTTICACMPYFGVAWSPDGSILFGSHQGPLMKVPETGGTPEPATTLDAGEGEVSHRLPHLLPDGRTITYTALPGATVGNSWKRARIFAQRLGDKERHLLVEGGSDGRWVPPGNLLFAREGRLFTARFDTKALQLREESLPILEGVSHSIWTQNVFDETGAAMVDLSGAGPFGWIPGSVFPEPQSSLAWVDASGKETPVDLPKGPFLGGRISPDGGRLLVHYAFPGKQAEVLDLSRGGRRNVTFEMNPRWAIWGPGPDRITFTSDHEGPVGIYSRAIDGRPEEVETLWGDAGSSFVGLGSWSRDGKILAFVVDSEKTRGDIWLLEGKKAPRPLVASRFREVHPDISPDGRWLLYASSEPGRMEVFVRPLSGEGSPRQVSVGGGQAPLWSRDGSAILYWADNGKKDRPVLFRVRSVAAGEGLSFGRPERLLEGPYTLAYPGQGWDVAPDGRFLVIKGPGEADRRAWYEKVLSDRIRIDVGGFPSLLAGTGKKP